MADYHFPSVPVYSPDPLNGDFDVIRQNLTGGQAYETPTGTTPLQLRGESGEVLTSIKTDANGMSTPFITTVPEVYIRFGDGPAVYLYNNTLTSAHAADAAADAAEANTAAQAAVAQAAAAAASASESAMFADQARIAAQEAAGTSGGTTGGAPAVHQHPVSDLSDMTAAGRDLARVANLPAVRGLIGAGTGNSSVTVDGALTGAAASAASVATLTANLNAALSRLGAAESRLTALEADPRILYVETEGATHPDARSQDLSVYRVATTTTPAEPTDPGAATLYRQLWMTGATDNTELPQTPTPAGTGDTPLDVRVAGTMIQVVDSIPRVHVPPGTSANTWRWTGLTLGAFGVEFDLQVNAYPTGSTTILIMGGVYQLTISNAGAIAVTTSAGAVVGSISPALTLGTRYTFRFWRANTTTGTTMQARIIEAATGTQLWPTAAQGGTSVARDVGVATGTTFIMGRTGTTTSGEFLWSKVSISQTGAELNA